MILVGNAAGVENASEMQPRNWVLPFVVFNLHISTPFSATMAVHHLFCHARGKITVALAVGNTAM